MDVGVDGGSGGVGGEDHGFSAATALILVVGLQGVNITVNGEEHGDAGHCKTKGAQPGAAKEVAHKDMGGVERSDGKCGIACAV